MENNEKRIPLSLHPQIDETCSEHHHIGGLPCPWPECQNGIREDFFIGYVPSLPKDSRISERRFVRRRWKSFDGEDRYSWDDTSFFADFQAKIMIREENIRCFGKEPTGHETIYHYTDIHGLKGIIDTGEIWLTDYQYMNDSKEIVHGLNSAKRILKELRKKPEYSGQENLFDIWEFALNSGPPGRICIACFSLDEGDSLSQWRGYGRKNAGLSLGFRVDASEFWTFRESTLDRVVYDESKQRRMLENLFHIYSVISEWDTDKRIYDSKGNEITDKNPKKMVDLMISELYQKLVFFKDRAFSDEREARWVFIESRKVYESLGIKSVKKRFRISENKIIPFLTSSDLEEIGFRERENKEKVLLPLKDIVVGPQKDKDLVSAGIRELLDSNGYESVPIRDSKVPFRP